MEDKKYRAILREVAQVIVGEFVSEDDDVLVLKKPAIVNVQAQGQSISLQFVPLDLVSFNPPISLKVLCKEGEDLNLEVSFRKRDMLVDDVALSDELFNGYEESLNPNQIVTPPTPGGIVGPDGAPLDDTPKKQDLFSD